MKVLVTGASGFVGRAVCHTLIAGGHAVRGAFRYSAKLPLETTGVEQVLIGSLDDRTDWSAAVAGVDVVVHLAARVHVIDRRAAKDLSAFLATNVDGSARLAEQAARAGVKRFVFVSSAGVGGVSSGLSPLSEARAPAPHSAYTQSKLQAEMVLFSLAEQFGFECVVLRPPLVYGPAAPGNLDRLVAMLRRRVPLPFATIENRRSMIAVSNLADVIAVAVTRESASGTYYVADDDVLSTPEIIESLSSGLGLAPRLVPFPTPLLKWGLWMIGRESVFQQLCGDFVVDNSRCKRDFDWSPRIRTRNGLVALAREAATGIP
jgi:nucleoside-diphosphate-sugar epimerase